MPASTNILFNVPWRKTEAYMLSRNLEQTLRQALAQANARRHEYATLEHLLLALTEDQDAIASRPLAEVEAKRK